MAEPSALSDLRFIVGRSGSSVEVEVVEVVEVGVLELVESVVELSDRRFMVGRFGSSLVAVAFVLVFASAWLVSPLEPVSTGKVFEGLRAATFFGAASGLTLP